MSNNLEMKDHEILDLINETRLAIENIGVFPKGLLDKEYSDLSDIGCLEVALELAEIEKIYHNNDRCNTLKNCIIKVCNLEIGTGTPTPDMPYFNPQKIASYRNILDKAIAL